MAGVYFEKILKDSDVSLWIRQLQLSGLSMFLSPIAVCILDWRKVKSEGFLVGYTPAVWGSTVAHSIGGLIVALVIKYADNILKGFASSSTIILTFIISVLFLQFRITPQFSFIVSGSLLVILSIFLYGKPDLVLRVPVLNSLIKDRAIFFENKR